MKSKIHPRQKESLPIEAGNSCGLFSAPNSVCFLTGSDMSTLTPGSTTFHILWLRHHNKMATQLKVGFKKFERKTVLGVLCSKFL